jgi:preprotein translocase subunit SecD/SecD/SecF fusion protein
VKKAKKSTFFIVFIVIMAFAYTTFFGVAYYHGDIDDIYLKGLNDIRLGIDVKGGVDATFSPADDINATNEQMDAVLETIKMRLASQNILDSETYVDHENDNVIVRFPWQAGETEFNPEEAVQELGQTALLLFIKGDDKVSAVYRENYINGIGDEDKIVLTGANVTKATDGVNRDETGTIEYIVDLEFDDVGRASFGAATTELYSEGGQISIWMDDVCISSPTVQAPLTDGRGQISGQFTAATAKQLADQINSGALPFKLETTSFKTISPTLGQGALDAMLLAAVIAFAFIACFMMFFYRLQGFVAVIVLIWQLAGILAFCSGYFGFMPSSTLTIPGIAGIILSIGMGVDANVINGERVKEEINSGKSLDSALKLGFDRAFSAIFDGNITVVIVAITLMGAFGVPDSMFAKMLNPVFHWFGISTEGAVYSFGFTLLTGVILNQTSVLASRLMLTSLAKFKCFRNKKFYGTGITVKSAAKAAK